MKDQIANKVLQYLESAELFAKTEIPIYVNEFLTYYFFENLIYAVLLFILSLLIVFGIYKFYKHEFEDEEEGAKVIFAIVFLLFALIPFGFSVGKTTKCIKIKVAPRVFLVDEFRK